MLHIMANSLDKLVDDVMIRILQILTVRALLSLRKTSRRYYLLTQLHSVWYARFCAEVLVRNLPPPGSSRQFSLLSAAELERRTLRALYLHNAWPHLSANVIAFRTARGRVDQVVFIPGGSELLTVQGDKIVHWLVVSWRGLAHGLQQVSEWTPFEEVPCHVVKNRDLPGVIAVGPREPSGSHHCAKVVLTSLKAPFTMLREYSRVPGVVVGVWKHLLLLDASTEAGERGLELLNWRTQTSGTALLPGVPDLFGHFLDFVAFADHILVVWEHGVSVFPIPRVPVNGQVVVEHKRVFMFQEAISRPVAFTTCVARQVEPPCLDPNASLDRRDDLDTDWNWDGQRKRFSSSTQGLLPTLTIAARSRIQAERISMVMLIPLSDGEDCKRGGEADACGFPYRLTCLPPHTQATSRLDRGGEEGVGDPTPRAIRTLCLGSSGRGLFVAGRELRLVSPGLLILLPYEMQLGPVFETGKPLCHVDSRQQSNGNVDGIPDMARRDNAEEEESADGDRVDFDEGMGRFVVVTGRGGIELVQLD